VGSPALSGGPRLPAHWPHPAVCAAARARAGGVGRGVGTALVGGTRRLGQGAGLRGPSDMAEATEEAESTHAEWVKQPGRRHDALRLHGHASGPWSGMRPLLHVPLYSHTRPIGSLKHFSRRAAGPAAPRPPVRLQPGRARGRTVWTGSAAGGAAPGGAPSLRWPG